MWGSGEMAGGGAVVEGVLSTRPAPQRFFSPRAGVAACQRSPVADGVVVRRQPVA